MRALPAGIYARARLCLYSSPRRSTPFSVRGGVSLGGTTALRARSYYLSLLWFADAFLRCGLNVYAFCAVLARLQHTPLNRDLEGHPVSFIARLCCWRGHALLL